MSTTIDAELLRQLDSIPGATPTAVNLEMLRLASELDHPAPIVEVGVYKARNTCWLAAGAGLAAVGAHVIGVDPWDLLEGPGADPSYMESIHARGLRVSFSSVRTRDAAQHHVMSMGYHRWTTLWREFSTEAARRWGSDGAPLAASGRIGLLYIDGDHRHEAVVDDIHAWVPLCEDGATVTFDDYCAPFSGVVAAVNEAVRDGVLSAPHVVAGRLAVCRKLER
jgi:Methyltransferase domain